MLITSTAWFDADRDLAILEYYCATKAEAEHRHTAMTSFLEPFRQENRLTGSVRDMPAEDWSETWKKFFHTELGNASYSPKVTAAVKALGETYTKNALVIVEGWGASPEVSEPIIRGMISNYAFSTQLLIGNGGNA